MTELLIANMAPLMFAALVIFLLLGYPVAFSLAANGLFFGIVAIHLGLLQPQLLQALPERVFGIMRNDTLLAIPFFAFMGLILERSGMAEDLLETIGQMFGPVRGGLMTCMGVFLSSGFLVCCRFLVWSGKAVPRPVACDQVRGAAERCQGTEMLA